MFVLLTIVYIPFVEEPMLVARFRQPYLRSKMAVRRFIPRLRAVQADGPPAGAVPRPD